ncbi:MAG TPA: DUF805 domain-containing protein [Aeromonadales bacterium]|nr:DUF805 domain-containing protein [Aeromonadales bacterium]
MPVFFIMFVFMIRRLNDLDKTGWLSLLTFIPIVGAIFGLYVLFAKGSPGSNSYGPAPDENPTWVKVVAIGLPILMIILGIAVVTFLPGNL